MIVHQPHHRDVQPDRILAARLLIGNRRDNRRFRIVRLFVPIAQFLFDFQTVLMLTAILHDFSNTAKLFLFYRHLDFRLLLLYGIPSTVFVILGAWLSKDLYLQYLELILGVFLLLFGSFVMMYPSFRLSQDRVSAVTGGSVAGFLAGLIGTGGAIRGMSLAAFDLEKSTFIATSAGIDFLSTSAAPSSTGKTVFTDRNSVGTFPS